METPRFTIKAAASKTGVSAHTIRAWERRYSALAPGRTVSNQRLYDEADLERLRLLRLATENGHTISQVANLPTTDLRVLANPLNGFSHRSPAEEIGDGSVLNHCRRALERFDGEELARELGRGAILLGAPALIETVVVPLLEGIGRGWDDRTVTISQEHIATTVIRTLLERIRTSVVPERGAHRLLVTTPANQHHEIGAALVAASAATEGWQVVYLGPNLPADEIVDAAVKSRVHAICLSLVFPMIDPGLPEEFRRLRRGVGSSTPIIVGGRASSGFADVFTEIDAKIIGDLRSLSAELARIARHGSAERR